VPIRLPARAVGPVFAISRRLLGALATRWLVCISDVDRQMDDPHMNGSDPNGTPATEQR
jgi:hypothetical protein